MAKWTSRPGFTWRTRYSPLAGTGQHGFVYHPQVEEACYLADRVLILTNKPASVKEDLSLHMPRPRDIASPEFIENRIHVENAIKWW